MEHNPAGALFLAIGLIVVASRIGGTIARRFHQPRVLGELIIGVILGPTLIDLLHQPVFHGIELHGTIKLFAELGVLLLMFIVGLEVNMGELAKVGRVGVIAGFAGAFIPVLLTIPLVLLFQYAWQPALFAGVTLAATSVSISAQVLLELGVLRTKVGNALLATALIDDIVAILLVSLTVAVTGSAEARSSADLGSLLAIVLTMALYLVGAFLLAWFVLPRAMNWLANRPSLAQSYGIPAFALIALLVFGWSAEELGGMAAITGAFLAGMGFSRSKERVRHEIETAISGIAYTFLVPIFFVDVGLQIDLSAFPLTALPLALLLLIIAIVSKIGGCGLGGRLGGFDTRDSLRLGVCMISRGEVGLIIAALGIGVGVFSADDPLFSSLFLVILISTLITPPLVRAIFRGENRLMKLVVLITAQVEDGLDVALAWQEAGAPGVTIVRAHGLHALQQEMRHGDVELPRMVSSMAAAMAAILDNAEERNQMLLSLVDDALVDTLIDATSAVLGDLTDPNHGILFVVPVDRAIGVRDHRSGKMS